MVLWDWNDHFKGLLDIHLQDWFKLMFSVLPPSLVRSLQLTTTSSLRLFISMKQLYTSVMEHMTAPRKIPFPGTVRSLKKESSFPDSLLRL